MTAPNDTPRPPAPHAASPRVAVLYCAVLETEIEHFAASQSAPPLLVKLEQGLHNDPPLLRKRLQETVDQVEAEHPEVDVMVLGYGLCSRGTESVTARRARLVIPRAHDCITLLLGSKERYAAYVQQHPGTYWYSPGWNRHHVPPGPERYREHREAYVRDYGEDNADYLMEMEQGWLQAYDRATYVDLTIGATDKDLAYTKSCAGWLGWQYDRQVGDDRLLRDLLTGPWDDQRFAVLEPGQAIQMTADDRVVRVIEAADTPDAPVTT